VISESSDDEPRFADKIPASVSAVNSLLSLALDACHIKISCYLPVLCIYHDYQMLPITLSSGNNKLVFL